MLSIVSLSGDLGWYRSADYRGRGRKEARKGEQLSGESNPAAGWMTVFNPFPAMQAWGQTEIN